MPFATLSGVRVHYEVAGAGHPVIFLHGHAIDSRLWRGQIGPIARSYTVITYDLRGHGDSDAPATGYSRTHYAEELQGLIKHLGVTRPSLVGHSLGGGVAMEYALSNPGRLSALVLVDSGLDGFSYSGSFSGAVLKQRALLRQEGVSRKFVRAAMVSPLFAGVRKQPELQGLVKTMLSGWSGASWLDGTEYPAAAASHLQRLGSLRLPTLVVVGESDLPGFHEVANELTKRILVVRTAIVPEAGHLAPLESPEAFNDILLDFLGGAVGKALI